MEEALLAPLKGLFCMFARHFEGEVILDAITETAPSPFGPGLYDKFQLLWSKDVDNILGKLCSTCWKNLLEHQQFCTSAHTCMLGAFWQSEQAISVLSIGCLSLSCFSLKIIIIDPLSVSSSLVLSNVEYVNIFLEGGLCPLLGHELKQSRNGLLFSQDRLFYQIYFLSKLSTHCFKTYSLPGLLLQRTNQQGDVKA